MIEIGLIDANDFVVSATLSAVVYKLHLAWNDTSKNWTLSIMDNLNDIVSGITIVPNFPLLSQYKRHGTPRGELMAVVNNNQQIIGRKDFVNGVADFLYVPEGELHEILETQI